MRFRPNRVYPSLLAHARTMRHEPAPAEQLLWKCLRDRRLNGLKFRRQFSVGRYVADFYCADCRLVVELDGESHDRRGAYDAERTCWLESQGYRVVRFVNTDVFENLDGVLEAILSACEKSLLNREGGPLTPALSPEYRGEGVSLSAYQPPDGK